MYIWGKGSGRGSGRVRLFVGNRGSGQRFAGSGRVQEKWPVDNSDAHVVNKKWNEINKYPKVNKILLESWPWMLVALLSIIFALQCSLVIINTYHHVVTAGLLALRLAIPIVHGIVLEL